jgi:hypothetical protein
MSSWPSACSSKPSRHSERRNLPHPPVLKLAEVAALLGIHRRRLELLATEVVKNRQDPKDDEIDAHQVVEDFGKYHHYYTEDKADDSRDEAHVRKTC